MAMGRSRVDIKPTLTMILAETDSRLPEAPHDSAGPDRLRPQPGGPGRSGSPLATAPRPGADRARRDRRGGPAFLPRRSRGRAASARRRRGRVLPLGYLAG